MFAGSCIGVIVLVLVLEFLRRLGKDYDRFLVRQHGRQKSEFQTRATIDSEAPLNGSADGQSKPNVDSGIQDGQDLNHVASAWDDVSGLNRQSLARPRPFTPNLWQQLTRALLHMLQFGVAYFIMLLAMYYNGYFIICILIGAFLGSFIFSWQSLGSE